MFPLRSSRAPSQAGVASGRTLGPTDPKGEEDSPFGDDNPNWHSCRRSSRFLAPNGTGDN
jgi:hypothetical protein